MIFDKLIAALNRLSAAMEALAPQKSEEEEKSFPEESLVYYNEQLREELEEKFERKKKEGYVGRGASLFDEIP